MPEMTTHNVKTWIDRMSNGYIVVEPPLERNAFEPTFKHIYFREPNDTDYADHTQGEVAEFKLGTSSRGGIKLTAEKVVQIIAEFAPVHLESEVQFRDR